LSLSTIVTRGSEYLRGAYSLPIGLDGWRLGLNGSAMGYKVIKGDMGVVGGTGEAYTEGVELSYPLDRSPESSSTFSLSAEAKQFKNVMATGQVMTDYDAEVLVAQFSGVDRAFTKTSGVFNYNFQLTHGQINLHDSGMTNAQTDLNKINGNFNKLRTNITFIEPWTPKTDVYMGFTGQLADKNLDSSEKFQLGGAMGVRAYPTGEGSGSDGKMLNLEIRHRLDNGVTVTGFYDWGHVEDLHTPNPASNNSNNSYDLKGFGLSGAYTFRNGVTAKATWATREGDNPNPKIPSGTDQDGSRDRNRFWLQMTVPF
jgi:hemolysin activation/secretion protein